MKVDRKRARPGTLAARQAATERVLAQFRARPFRWAGANCIRLARAQGVAMGHDLPPVPLFRSALGAKKALAARGAQDLADLLDQYFERHPAPAFARLGDLVVLRSDDDLRQSIGISDGFGNLFGWHPAREDGLSAVLQAEADIIAAWKV